MAGTIKIRAKVKGDTCVVKALIKHPMETGLRKNKKTGKNFPAHHITEVACTHNGASVMDIEWGGSISKNPYLSIKFKGANKGDTFALSWMDNQGAKESAETKIK